MLKDLIVSLVVMMVVMCVLNSIGAMFGQVPSYPPYPWPIGISEVKDTKFGTKRDEPNYPEINYVDQSRNSAYMTDIVDGMDRSNADFPLSANN